MEKIKHPRDIRALQFEIGNNCNNNCDFCYLKESRVISSPEQQILSIKKVYSVIDTCKLDEYQAIGLIGGEFFEGQMNSSVKIEFHKLIQYILKQDILEFGLTASLISSNQDDLGETLDAIHTDKIVILCTSYDAIGRFKTREQEEQWFKNIALVVKNYPNIVLHTQTILSQAFIDKVIENVDFLRRIVSISTIDFKFPALNHKDSELAESECQYNKLNFGKSNRNTIFKRMHTYPPNFFINNRNSLFKCLRILYEVCGHDAVYSIQCCKARSDTFYHFSANRIEDHRGNASNLDRNAPCGHQGDSFCYLNSDKCARCDVLDFYNNYHT